MNLLTREQILKSDDLKTEEVSVPEWGGKVLVSAMSGDQRDVYEASLVDIDSEGNVKSKSDNLRAKLAAAAMVDETGNRLFSDKDVIALGKKSSAALDRVVDVAQRLNGVGKVEKEKAAKNS